MKPRVESEASGSQRLGGVVKARTPSGLEGCEPQRQREGFRLSLSASQLGRNRYAGGAHLSQKVGRAGSLGPKPCPPGYSNRSVW